MSEETRPELIYVSWGGSGRGVAFRQAYDRAVAEERGIVYLAILDSPTFSDLDDTLLDLVTEELTWLLEAQLRLVDRENLATGVATRTFVRTGEVAEVVGGLTETLGTDLVLLGAPIPLTHHDSVEALVAELARTTGVTVEVVETAPSPNLEQ